jgi:AcrB/AcrD/AcrF family
MLTRGSTSLIHRIQASSLRFAALCRHPKPIAAEGHAACAESNHGAYWLGALVWRDGGAAWCRHASYHTMSRTWVAAAVPSVIGGPGWDFTSDLTLRRRSVMLHRRKRTRDGRLFREFTVTLSATIAISLVVSLTTTPMMCAYLLPRRREDGHNGLHRAGERAFAMMLDLYDRSLQRALQWPGLVMVGLLATLYLAVHFFVNIPKGFMPEQDTG